MYTVVGIAGSLREGSYNAKLLRAAAQAAPFELELEEASIRDIPLYDGDREREDGIPDAVEHLKDRIAGASGLLLVTPEYNNSIPGVFKNAIDWLSRPPGDIARVFGNKPVALMGASPGRGGTRLSQAAWLPILRTLGTLPYFGKQVQIAGAATAFDDAGHLQNDELRALVAESLAGFRDFIEISS